jgi:prepilin-type N-terminal cleavage/methylation domain-containing protein
MVKRGSFGIEAFGFCLIFGFTMKSKMKKLHKDQSGLTFVELLIVIAIAGFIAAAITGVLFQVLTINTRTSNHMTAVRQAQQAGFWVSPDVMMAKTVNTTGITGFPLTLTWNEWVTNKTYTVIYTVADNKLWRSKSVTGENSTVLRVAEYIDPNQTRCAWNNATNTLTFNVTATVGAESETRLYEVKPRPGS